MSLLNRMNWIEIENLVTGVWKKNMTSEHLIEMIDFDSVCGEGIRNKALERGHDEGQLRQSFIDHLGGFNLLFIYRKLPKVSAKYSITALIFGDKYNFERRKQWVFFFNKFLSVTVYSIVIYIVLYWWVL